MSLNPVAFWFLRHGETDWNAQGLSQGNTDIALNAVGRAQAARAARTLAGAARLGAGAARLGAGMRFGSIVASPLSRARDTAKVVADALGMVFTIDPDLREVGFGEQEGQPMGDWYDDWIADRYTPPGAETFAALRARTVAAINRATATSSPLAGPVLVVAHGALWRAFRHEAGLPANVRTPNALPLFAEPGGDGWRLTALELAPEV